MQQLAIPQQSALVPLESPFTSVVTVEVVRSTKTAYETFLGRFPSKESRRTMAASLEVVADLLTEGVLPAAELPWHELRTEHTQWLRAQLIDLYSPRSVNKHLSAVRGVLTVAENMDLLTADQLRRALYGFSNVKPTGELRGRMLSQLEIRAFLEACEDGTLLGIRDAAMFALLYMAGAARRSEVVDIKRSDYDAITGKVEIRAGKGNKYRFDFIKEGRELINRWLELTPDCDGPILLEVHKTGSIQMGGITAPAVYYALQQRAAKAGLQPFTPHDVRRTAISVYLDNGVDISTIAKKVGHASVAQTARYDRRDERAIESASHRLHLPFTGANR